MSNRYEPDTALALFGVRLFGFLDTWQSLAQVGACDGEGGMEFTRVIKEWVFAGCPEDYTGFIRKHANEMPSGHDNGRSG